MSSSIWYRLRYRLRCLRRARPSAHGTAGDAPAGSGMAPGAAPSVAPGAAPSVAPGAAPSVAPSVAPGVASNVASAAPPETPATRTRAPGLLSAARLWPVLRQALPLALGGLCLWLLVQRLDGLDQAALAAAFHRIPASGWVLAALATAVSFWAVGRYDVVVHRHLHTGMPDRRAAAGGMASIALAQTLGFGVITGALARWRALPEASLLQCSRISVLVAVSFLAGWAVITALACLLLPAPAITAPYAWLVLAAALAVAVLALLSPGLALPGGRRITLPSLPAMGAILWFTLIDTAAAALALSFLLPADLSLGLVTLYPVFLLALGAALISGTPGGVGPFELMLVTLLPAQSEPALMAAVLGFRLVYYALPAALGAAYLARPGARRMSASPAARRPPPRPGPRLLAHARRSELGVARQNGGRLLAAPGAAGFTITTGQTVTLLFDPAAGPSAALIPALRARARAENRIPVLYKCAARSALAARQAGFALWHVADEAVLDPTRFSLDTPRHRQLRRKLRQAERAGLTISRAAALPLVQMQAIDAQWRARQGGARGLTMGRFDAAYLSHHQVFLAWQGDALQGFVTFHASAHELCLDIMRQRDDAPAGTMQALVAEAIAQAAHHGRQRLSLAAIPALRPAAGPLERRLRARAFAASGGPGLARFKSAFAPRYEPLYLAAPSLPGLMLAAADLALSVRRAPPPQHHREEFAIAPALAL